MPPLPPDTLLTAPEHLALSFCPCTKRIAVSVKRSNGEDYKYVFDEESNACNPLNCVNCQPQVMETDLYPLYSIYHASQFVIFVLNAITDLWEQYVYNPETEQFEQVNIPELIIDFSRYPSSDVLVTVNSEKGQVVIRKSEYGYLMKEKFRKEMQTFVPMLSDSVKTIPLEQKLQVDSPERPRLKIGYDPYLNHKVVFVLKSRRLLSAFYYNSNTAKFVMLHSDTNLSERYLYPKYVAFSESINKNVMYAKNGMTGDIEQFIYCEKTLGFEQVQVSDIVYDSSLDSKSDIIMVIPGTGDAGTIVIMRHFILQDLMKFQSNPKTLQYEEMAPVEVRFLSVQQQELVLEDSYSDTEAKKEKSATRIVKTTLREVTELLEKTLAGVSEDRKVPSTSPQADVPLSIMTTLEVVKELKTPETKAMIVDENLEAEAPASSPENSSEGGRTGDAPSPSSQHESIKSTQKEVELQTPKTQMMIVDENLEAEALDSSPENSSNGGRTGDVDSSRSDAPPPIVKQQQVKTLSERFDEFYGFKDESEFCRSVAAGTFVSSPKKKKESNMKHESPSSKGGPTVYSDQAKMRQKVIEHFEKFYGFDNDSDICGSGQITMYVPLPEKKMVTEEKEAPKNHPHDSDFDSDTSEIDMTEFDEEIEEDSE